MRFHNLKFQKLICKETLQSRIRKIRTAMNSTLVAKISKSLALFCFFALIASEMFLVANARRYINVDKFELGQAAEIAFKAPDRGSIGINFRATGTDIVFHIAIRYSTKELVLNSRHQSKFGAEIRPPNFLFAPSYDTTVRVEAKEGGMYLYCNGRFIACFPHRMDLKTIRRIGFLYEDDNSPTKAEFKRISVEY